MRIAEDFVNWKSSRGQYIGAFTVVATNRKVLNGRTTKAKGLIGRITIAYRIGHTAMLKGFNGCTSKIILFSAASFKGSFIVYFQIR